MDNLKRNILKRYSDLDYDSFVGLMGRRNAGEFSFRLTNAFHWSHYWDNENNNSIDVNDNKRKTNIRHGDTRCDVNAVSFLVIRCFDLNFYFLKYSSNKAVFFPRFDFILFYQMQTPYSHHKKVRVSCFSSDMEWLLSFNSFKSEWNTQVTCSRSSHQEKCTTFLLVSWEEETQSLVSENPVWLSLAFRFKVFSGVHQTDIYLHGTTVSCNVCSHR